MKKYLFLLFVLQIPLKLFCGEKALTDSGSVIIMMQGNYANEKGRLYEDENGNAIKSMNCMLSVNTLVKHSIFLGAGVNLDYSSQGDVQYHILEVGPRIGGIGTFKKNCLYSISAFSPSIVNMEVSSYSFSGYGFSGSLGFIYTPKQHLGFIVEGVLKFIRVKEKTYKTLAEGNIFTINVGIAGLIFK
jgi:hypothetical protein